LQKEVLDAQIQLALNKATTELTIKENRQEQLELTQFIRRFLDYAKDPGHTAISEAGTGVGKSFSYLVAVCEWMQAVKTEDYSPKVVIATNTISLQGQLSRKDIPIIQGLYPNLKFQKAKGRNNYICRQKIADINNGNLFTDDTEKGQTDLIINWLKTPAGKEGDKSDVDFQLNNKTWQSVCSDSFDCLGLPCPYSRDCCYNIAKKKIPKADVIITTHAMVLTELTSNPTLPTYDLLVADEAHNFGRNASNALTVSIGRQRFYRLIKKSKNQFCRHGFKLGKVLGKIQEWQKDILPFVNVFFDNLTEGRTLTPPGSEVAIGLMNILMSAQPLIVKAIKSTKLAVIKAELQKFLDEITLLKTEIEIFFTQNQPDTVYWVEKNEAKHVPINIGKMLTGFWASRNSILTSATLCVAKNFDLIRSDLGLSKDTSYGFRVESPFNYKKNAMVYIPPLAPSPKATDYIDYVAETVISILKKTQGRTFVLFTSFQMMKHVYKRVEGDESNRRINDLGRQDYCTTPYNLLIQGSDTRERLLEIYRQNKNAVLFGTNTFWEGIDENIDCVIITKLPFAVPTDPVEEARYEAIKKTGGNPFISQSIPQCAIRLKQGAGRLIRNKNKKGVIVICDPRISQPWGKSIRNTLPDMPWTDDINLMDKYLVE
jgi:ATP-dependent DNA helicase DinG